MTHALNAISGFPPEAVVFNNVNQLIMNGYIIDGFIQIPHDGDKHQ